MLRPLNPIVAVLVGFSAPACAQAANPTPANCSGVFRATVESGRPHPRLLACTSQLVPQIVEVVAEAPRHPQPQYLARVFTNASAYRDPAIARAAVTLAGNQSAPATSQMLGWVLATAQLHRGLYLRPLGEVEGWFTSDARTCDWADPSDVEFFRDNGLPAEFEGELKRLAEAVMEDQSRPANVRDYARCVAMLLPYSTPDDG